MYKKQHTSPTSPPYGIAAHVSSSRPLAALCETSPATPVACEPQPTRASTPCIAPLPWYLRVLLSALPVGVLCTAAGLASLVLPQDTLGSLYGLAVLVGFTGRWVVLALVVQEMLPFSPLFIAHVVVLIKVCVAWFVAVNLTALYQLPWVGAGLRSLEARGQITLSRYPWMRRMATVGMTVFVALPLPGMGTVAGTIVARLIGFSLLRSFIVVFLGTAIGVYGMILGAQTLLTVLPPQPSSAWGGMMRLGLSALVLVSLSWVVRQGTARRNASRLESISEAV